MANFVCTLLVLLISIAVVLAINYDNADKNNMAEEFSKQQIMKLLSLPQKSNSFPTRFNKVKFGERVMGNIKWTNCNSSAPLKIISLTVSDPVSIPGSATVGFNGTAGVDVTQGLSAKLKIEKSVFGVKVTVPCVDNIGSCTYNDVCGMIPPTPPSGCPPPLPTYKIPCACPFPKVTVPCVDNIGSCTYNDVCGMIPPTPPSGCPPPLPTYKIPCACPFPKGAYSLPDSTFPIPDIPIPSWLAEGDYYIKVQAYDKAGTNLACYDFVMTLS